jgi:type IV secretion system protein VirD4
MNDKRKVFFVLPLLAVALLFLTSVLTHMFYVVSTKQLAKLPDVRLVVRTVQQARADQTEISPKLKASALLAGLLSLGATLGLGYLLLRDQRSMYGQARFASFSEVKKAGFLEQKGNSLIVGKMNGRYLFYTGQQFAILAAPTRSGKGVGIVIPNLLTYGESIVVLDIKQENFNLTSGFRKNHGQEVFLFNPFAEDGRSHRWNPLSYITSDPRGRVSDTMSIALMLFPVSADGKDQFWKSQAQNVFVALVLYLVEQREYQLSLGCPEDLLSPVTVGAVRVPLKDHLQNLSQMSFLGNEAKTAFSGLLGNNAEVFASIMGTFKEPLLPWLNPVVDAATSANDFLLTDVRRKKMSIYIGILPNKIADAKLIVNLFFSQLINENTKQLPQENPELKYQCVLLLDEFTSLGRVDIIAKALSYIAGYNLRLFPIIQSIAQLDATYGKDDSRTMLTNHALQILYTPRAQSDANDYSEMLGYESVRKESTSIGRERSRSVSDEKRALMLPQELKAMSVDEEIIIYESISSPIRCEKIRYYKDKLLMSRLLKAPEIPVLKY